MTRTLALFAALAGAALLIRSSARHGDVGARRPVRDAGPDQMRDPPREWTETDERMDESFPASDPPGTY
ncbi:hypothetical protein [Paracoccus indicus]|uniref:hypothetical protein n=1 Tax=Paracoccus indicus TaxID=2079229 RepID=UPI001FE8FE3B|nr:hypothetical protein [Paracoccus indicus]